MNVLKVSEQKIKAKLQILQQHSRDLTMRESTLSKEKLEFSQEKLELQAVRKKMYENRCSLCKIGEKSEEINKMLSQHGQQPVSDEDDDVVKFDLEKFDINRLDKILDREVELSLRKMNENRNFEIDLDDIPNITEMDDEILDPQLLLLKIDALSNNM